MGTVLDGVHRWIKLFHFIDVFYISKFLCEFLFLYFGPRGSFINIPYFGKEWGDRIAHPCVRDSE